MPALFTILLILLPKSIDPNFEFKHLVVSALYFLNFINSLQELFVIGFKVNLNLFQGQPELVIVDLFE